MEKLMQLSVDISLDNLLLLISKMDVNQIEEVKNKQYLSQKTSLSNMPIAINSPQISNL
jgi:hypothetical protein